MNTYSKFHLTDLNDNFIDECSHGSTVQFAYVLCLMQSLNISILSHVSLALILQS